MKNIVLYKSKYGNTFQYATWIAEELGWEIRDFSKFEKAEIKNYDTIIFGSGVYVGKMNEIKKVLEWFKEKPIIIFACGGNNNVEKDINAIKINNFSEDQLIFHTFFYLPGGIDFSKMKGVSKMMLNIFIKLMERKKSKTKEVEVIIESYYHPKNYVDKKHIQAIVSYAKKNLS